MQAPIARVLRFEDWLAPNLSLYPDIGLITFGNAELWIQTSGKAGVEHAKLFELRRIKRDRLRKMNVRRDECAALRVCHHLARGGIVQRVSVKEKLLRA